ncbi:MAG: TonB-dependent receptor [Flavihumibacter sp.]
MRNYLLVLLLMTAGPAAAQTPLDPVTITATLSQKRSSETGRNISIIKGEQLRNLPVHSLDELLRYVPGVEIQARGPMGAQSDIVLRGGTFQQVLVVLDGVRLNDPNTGHFNSYIPVAPEEIDRIEVLKGASSAIYGADAVGGVIYVITKTFAAKQEAEKTSVFGSVAGGQYGYINANAGLAYSNKKLHIGAGLLTNNADGIQQRGINGFFHNSTASASVKYFLNEKWNVAYRLAYDNRNFAAQNFYTTYVFDTAREKVSSYWQQARISYEGGKQRLSLDLGYKNLRDRYQFSPASAANENTSQLFQSIFQYERSLSEKTLIVSGFNFQQKRIRSNDRGNHSLFQLSPFVTLSQTLATNLYVRPSLQWIFFQGGNAELVPQLDISYKRNSWQYRASAGKTIRDADFTERYNNYNKTEVRSGSIGNPDLLAERSVSYELGADRFFKDRLKVAASVFQRFQQRLIDYSTTPYADMPRKDNLVPTGIYALAKNIARVRTSGIETDLQYHWNFSKGQRITASAGVIWMDSKSSDSSMSFYISSHARFMTNFSAVYQHEHFSFGVTGLYKKRNRQEAGSINAALTPAYFLANIRAEYRIFRQRLGVFTTVDNLFDKQYSDLLGAVMPGRWITGGVRYALR